MSKITEIKKQYPELNISVIDLFSKIDGTKTNKYLPLMCKLFSSRFHVGKMWDKRDVDNEMAHIKERMGRIGLNSKDMSNNELYAYYSLSDYFNPEDMELLSSFRKYNERGLIPNNDVTSYQNFDQIMSSVGLASLKDDEKELKSQIIREHDDETWMAVRPLTFGASAKYGAATKWCTTYQNDKQYFERYWKRGILVYFINKITGLKFAVFKSLDSERELSFWNATDQRVDFLELDIDDYMLPIIKQILKSDKTNRDLCTMRIQLQVEIECGRINRKSYDEPIERHYTEPQLDVEEERPVIQFIPPGRRIQNEVESIMVDTGEDMFVPVRERIRSLRELMGMRLQNLEVRGAHRVDEEDCQDNQG